MIHRSFPPIQVLLFSLLALSLPLLSSCHDNEKAEGERLLPSSLEVEVTIASSLRVQGDSRVGKKAFEEGDRLALLIGSQGKRVVLTRSSKGWEPRLLRRDIGSGETTVTAFHPVPEGFEAGEAIEGRLSAQQETPQGFLDSDLLVGSSTLSPQDRTLSLTLEHAMAMLEVRLEGSIPEEVQISATRHTSAPWSVSLNGYDGKRGSRSAKIHAQKVSPSKHLLLLFPEETTGTSTLLTIHTKQGEIPFRRALQLRKGEIQPLKLTLSASTPAPLPEPENPEEKFRNKTLWVKGINAPLFPRDNKESLPKFKDGASSYPKGEWITIMRGEDAYYYLPWSEGSGWYDCIKRNKERYTPGSDSQMCWACSATNVLLWWLEQNSDYISLYEEKIKRDKMFPLPSTRFSPEEDPEVFALLKRTFQNEAGRVDHALNWFMTNSNTGQLRFSNHNTNMKFKGFFPDVIPANSVHKMTAFAGSSNAKELFNEAIKESLSKGQAIALVVILKAGRKTELHSTNVWGAEFDDNGVVSALYWVDNNYDRNDGKPNNACIYRREVVYHKGQPKMLAYSGANPQYGIQISQVISVDPRRDLWAKWLGRALPERP